MKRRLTLKLGSPNEDTTYKKHVVSAFKNIAPDYYSMSVENIINLKIKNETVKHLARRIHTAIETRSTDSMKNKYDTIVNTYRKLESATHRRQFGIAEPNQPNYVSYVYLTKDHVAKVYVYDCAARNPSEFMIIKEVAFQQYAVSLMDKKTCDFKAPLILDYGKLSADEGKCVFYVVMENLKHERLDKALLKHNNITEDKHICSTLAAKLNTLNTCLESKDLFHNDFHHENIMIETHPETNQIQIALIDYGEASDAMKTMDTWEYTCERLLKIKNDAVKRAHQHELDKTKRRTLSKKDGTRVRKTRSIQMSIKSKRSRSHKRSLSKHRSRSMLSKTH